MTGPTDIRPDDATTDGSGGTVATLRGAVSDTVDRAGGPGLAGILALAAGAGAAEALGVTFLASVLTGTAGLAAVLANHGLGQYAGGDDPAPNLLTAGLTTATMAAVTVGMAHTGATDPAAIAAISGVAGLFTHALRVR